MHKSNINIALVTPAVAREGITKLLAAQVKVLQQAGYCVYIIVLSDFNDKLTEEFGIIVNKDNILLTNQKDTYLSIRNLLNCWGVVLPIVKFLKKNRIHVCVAHGPYAHFIMRLVSLISAILRYRLSLIQYFHINQYSQFPLNSLRRLAVNRVNKVLASYLDTVHVFVSNAVKNDVLANLITCDANFVLYNPVLSHNKVRLGLVRQHQHEKAIICFNPSTFYLLLSNRIEHSKGQVFFLGVVEELINFLGLTPEDLQVIIAGDGAQKNELLSLVHRKKIDKYVNYVGMLPFAELELLLRDSDIVVVPSLFEGFSYSTLEALNSGCLVLVSDAGGLKEVIKDGETGFLFKAGDAEDCLSKLKMIYLNRQNELINPDIVKQDLKERFSLDSYGQQLVQVISSM